MLVIRQEEREDREVVYDVVKKAFEVAEYTDGKEQDLVEKLRESKSFLPQLSLVAETEGKIVGYILFTKVKIGDKEELALAPLAVLPNYQRKGIGEKLVKEGHQIAKKLGYHYCIVLGSEKYYPKFGYNPAIQYGIKSPFKVKDKNFMAIELEKAEVDGVVTYAKEFGF